MTLVCKQIYAADDLIRLHFKMTFGSRFKGLCFLNFKTNLPITGPMNWLNGQNLYQADIHQAGPMVNSEDQDEVPQKCSI